MKRNFSGNVKPMKMNPISLPLKVAGFFGEHSVQHTDNLQNARHEFNLAMAANSVLPWFFSSVFPVGGRIFKKHGRFPLQVAYPMLNVFVIVSVYLMRVLSRPVWSGGNFVFAYEKIVGED
jgi:hypothetical protein